MAGLAQTKTRNTCRTPTRIETALKEYDMQIGDPIPNFSLPTLNDQHVSNDDLANGWAVIYFYPRDNTPGCTTEALDFSQLMDEFGNLNARVIGISADSIKKHENFTKKHDLKVELLSDESTEVCQAFGVWVEKKMYGKTHMGIERSTFLFNPAGILNKSWRKVKVSGHAEDVLNNLKEAVNTSE